MTSSRPPWDIDSVAPDVAILIALAEEFRTLATAVVEGRHAVRSEEYGGYDYFFLGPGGYRCVATIMDAMGPTPASQSAQRLLALGPASIVNIGIAGGLVGELCIGDVIVPREVAAYDETGKVQGPMGDAPWQRRGKSYHLTPALVDEAPHLSFAHPEAYERWRGAGIDDLRALEPTDQPGPLAELKRLGIVREAPEISTKHLASGSFVIASEAFAAWIREANADIHGAEMEAAGMLLANEFRRRPAQSLVIRGISDHVRASKSKVDAIGGGALRGLAMRNAWRLLCTLMEIGALPRVERPTPDSDELSQLKDERKRREIAGEDTTDVRAAILGLRRDIRRGPALAPGDVLAGRYELVEKIGRGGFANVWRAWDREASKIVAVKILHGEHAEERSRVDRFYGGARSMAKLHHPAVVRVEGGPDHDRGHHFFVMPWFEFGDLCRALKAAKLDRPRALEAVARAIEGLDHAHQHGLVHRDVKPSNILIDGAGLGWISDFDLVRDDDTTRGTRTNAGAGTFVYAAPEQLRDARSVDARADVYGAAMSVLYVLAGDDPPAMVMATEPEFIEALDCGFVLRGALRGALAYKLADRTTSCLELAAAIRGASSGPEWEAEGRDDYGRWASFRVGGVEQRMRWIAPGTFTMGSPADEDGRFDDEGPQHEVTLTQGFWMAETPCTQALWEAVMGSNPSHFKGPERPVEQVSWEDVEGFLERLNERGGGFRLPTEAEWEYACRAGTTTATYGELDEVAWYVENSEGATRDVGRKRSNAWGLHDMLGNVWEWCADGQRPYDATPVTNPTGPSGLDRVIRGGSWSFVPRGVRAAYRHWYGPGRRSGNLGFRLVRGQ